jgi:phosphatidylglycerol---prolipoprotein diacylglyceryl transferase
MYAIGFAICYFFYRRFSTLERQEVDSLLTYIFFWVVGGGRLGYCLLYDPLFFISHPLEIFAIWQGGMSFHGGFLWVIIAILLFAKRKWYTFFSVIDLLAVIVPSAIGLGRIGNWINGELPGYPGYAGIFPMMIGGIPHFPNPLFEAMTEWLLLLIIMITIWIWTRDNEKYSIGSGFLSGVFLLGYGMARLLAETMRLPDAHIGYLLSTSWLTLGMIYTLPMVVGGIYLVGRRKEKKI